MLSNLRGDMCLGVYLSLSRRRVLKYGVLGSVALASGGIGISFQRTRLVQVPSTLKVFTDVEFSILSAVTDRLFPNNPPFPSGSAAQVPERVDELMSTMPITVVEEFKQVLTLVENALTGLVFNGTPKPFSQCTPEVQDEILEDWRTSSLHFRRMVFRGLSGVCAGAYYGEESRFAAIGYGGPPRGLNPEAFK